MKKGEVKSKLLKYLTDEKSKILKGYENWSVDVPAGYEIYMKTFKEMIQNRKNKTQISETVEDSNFLFEGYDEEKKESLNIFQGKKHISHGIDFNPETLLNLGKELNLAIQPKKKATYYYYKRWLWLIFPWACLSAEEGFKYSNVMKQCYTNDTKGIRVKEEQRLTDKALDISVQAKMKRMMILNSKKRDYLIHASSLKDKEKSKKDKNLTSTRFRTTGPESAFKRGKSEIKLKRGFSGKSSFLKESGKAILFKAVLSFDETFCFHYHGS